MADYDFNVDPTLLVSGPNVPKLAFYSNFYAAMQRGLNGLPQGANMANWVSAIIRINAAGDLLDVDGPMEGYGGALGGYAASLPGEVTGASLTIDGTNYLTYTGRFVRFERATAQTLTIDGAVGDGFCMTGWQKGAGQVTIVPAGGLTLRNAFSHDKSYGQYAAFGLVVEEGNLCLFGATGA